MAWRPAQVGAWNKSFVSKDASAFVWSVPIAFLTSIFPFSDWFWRIIPRKQVIVDPWGVFKLRKWSMSFTPSSHTRSWGEWVGLGWVSLMKGGSWQHERNRKAENSHSWLLCLCLCGYVSRFEC